MGQNALLQGKSTGEFLAHCCARVKNDASVVLVNSLPGGSGFECLDQSSNVK